MENMNLSEYTLERFVLGELPASRLAEIELRLPADAGLRERVEAIRKSNAQALARYPGELVISRIRARRPGVDGGRKRYTIPSSPFVRRVLLASASLALVFLFVVFVAPWQRRSNAGWGPVSGGRDSTRAKGAGQLAAADTRLLVHRKRQDHVELLENGVRGRAGDLLQLAYFSAEEAYGAILSIDGSGYVTLHFPETRFKPATLEIGKKTLLDYSIELDNAPGFERFFFVTSRQPFPPDEALTAARDLARSQEGARQEMLRLPPTFKQYSFIILKGEK
jgi:hypothetical protein